MTWVFLFLYLSFLLVLPFFISLLLTINQDDLFH